VANHLLVRGGDLSTVDRGATDAALVAQAFDGDRASFDELLRRHAGPAWRLASAVGGSPEVAEAAVAAAFTNVFRQLGGGSALLTTPFRALVVRASIDAALAAKSAAPEAAAAPDANALITSYRALPGQWQAVLWLTIVEGGSTAQVGALLGLTTDAVARLASRSRAGLRQRFFRAGGKATDVVLDDLRHSLRVLVTTVPATLTVTANARFAEWHETTKTNNRRGVAAFMPFGPWAERVIAGTAAAVITAGIAAAIAIGGDQATRGTTVAAPAGSGQLASGQADPTGSGPTDGGGDAVPSSPPTVGPKSSPAADGPRGTNPGPGPGGPPPTPNVPAGTPGVTVGANVGGTPIAVGVGDQTGVQVGPIVVGTPPAAPTTPGVVVTTGVLPPIVIPLL
jgi:DNA-directed RNA polymerase specialized sigma24 family protein